MTTNGNPDNQPAASISKKQEPSSKSSVDVRPPETSEEIAREFLNKAQQFLYDLEEYIEEREDYFSEGPSRDIGWDVKLELIARQTKELNSLILRYECREALESIMRTP